MLSLLRISVQLCQNIKFVTPFQQFLVRQFLPKLEGWMQKNLSLPGKNLLQWKLLV